MSNKLRWVTVKFAVFALVMALVTAFLFFIFGQYRIDSTNRYSALFTDASWLKRGDSVRVAGIRVGTVDSVALQPDTTVLVTFDAARDVALTTGTRAVVRYLDLIGNRYLELADGPGSTTIQPPGSRIPADRTSPALDLDLLLGGLKPVIQGLNPRDVNALTNALIEIFQGQGPTLESLFAKVAAFSNKLADNRQNLRAVIDNLKTVLGTISKYGGQFSAAIASLEKLITALSTEREPIGVAIQSLDDGTASLADLLRAARPPLTATIEQLSRVAPLLDKDKDLLDAQLGKLPEDYRKLARLGSYGSFLQYYLCGLSFRVTDLQGRTAVFPWVKQEGGRCSES